MTIFKDNATEYFEAGYKVTPANGRAPNLFNDWDKCPYDVDYLISHYPNCNIGLVCGELSGVIAIDVDVDKELEPELYNAILQLLPPSPVAKFGSKGITLFYRHNPNIENRKQRRKGKVNPDIETLSTGAFTVLPPSISDKTNRPYIWLTPDNLLSIDKDDLPTLDDEINEKIGDLLARFDFARELREGKTTINGRPTFEEYPDRCVSGSHIYLSEIACAKILVDQKPFDQVLREIILEDQAINKTHSYFTCTSRKEWRIRKPESLVGNAVQFILAIYKNHKMLPHFNSVDLPVFDLDNQTQQPKKLFDIEFNASCCHKAIYEASINYSEAIEFPPEYMAFSAYQILSTLLFDKVKFVYRTGSAKALGFNCIILGNPSARKSPAIEVVYDVAKDAYEQVIDQMSDKIKRAKIEIDIKNKELKAAKDSEEIYNINSKLNELYKIAYPKNPFINDATIEAIYVEMANHPGMYHQFIDELHAWLKMYSSEDREKKGAMLTLIHTGVPKGFKIDRVDKARNGVIKSGILHVIGTAQPSIVGEFNVKNTGLIQRFHVVWPDYNMSAKVSQKKINRRLLDTIHGSFYEMLSNDHLKRFKTDVMGNHIIELDQDADELAIAFLEELRAIECSEILKQYFGKIEPMLYSLAAVNYLLDKTDTGWINGDQMQMAVNAAKLFCQWASKLYVETEMGNSVADKNLDQLVAEHWESLNKGEKLSAYLMKRNMPSKFGGFTKDELNDVIIRLFSEVYQRNAHKHPFVTKA